MSQGTFETAAEQMIREFKTLIKEPNHLRDVRLPSGDYADYYVQELEDFGWSVKWGYVVLQECIPNSRPNMGPNADGQNAEIEIVDAALIGQRLIDLPLNIFTKKQLCEARDEIEARLNP